MARVVGAQLSTADLIVDSTTASTSTTTGSIQTAGGVGIGGALYGTQSNFTAGSGQTAVYTAATGTGIPLRVIQNGRECRAFDNADGIVWSSGTTGSMGISYSPNFNYGGTNASAIKCVSGNVYGIIAGAIRTTTNSSGLTVSGIVSCSGQMNTTNTTASTSTTTGALRVAGGVGIVGDVNVGGDANIGNIVLANDSIRITEQASVPAAPGAGNGTLWIRNDTPNILVYTDDAGTDFDLNVTGGGESLSATLSIGNTTGGNDIVVSSGDDIAGVDAATGGALSIRGGSSSTNASVGGAVSVTGGTPGATAVGGAVSITGGAGGSTSGNGGAVTITSGAPSSGIGGAVTIKAANSVVTAFGQVGPTLSILGGNGAGTGSGGPLNITAGSAGTTGTGGAMTLTGGAGGSSSGNGGHIVLNGGGTTDGQDGLVIANGVRFLNSEIVDINRAGLLGFGSTASAVSYIKITNTSGAEGDPIISSTTSGSNVGITFQDTNDANILRLGIGNDNYLNITTGGTGGGTPSIWALGTTDVNVSIDIDPQGTGHVKLGGNGLSFDGINTMNVIVNRATWNPTASNLANLTGTAAYSGNIYSRMGDRVWFCTRIINLSITSTAGTCVLNLTAPVAPAGNEEPCGSVAVIGQDVQFYHGAGWVETVTIGSQLRVSFGMPTGNNGGATIIISGSYTV